MNTIKIERTFYFIRYAIRVGLSLWTVGFITIVMPKVKLWTERPVSPPCEWYWRCSRALCDERSARLGEWMFAVIKTGSSGLIAYRLLTKDLQWLWLQTSSKVIYKNSKPDFVICTHRHLT